MPDPAFEQLRAELGGQAPERLRRLKAEHLLDLADAVRGARHRETEALEAASERALSHVPRLLRGPVRRIVG